MPISITALQSKKSISQDDEAHDQANNIENGIDAAENFFSIFLLFHPGSSSSSGSSATENMKRVRVTLESSSELRVRFFSLERSSPLLDIGQGT